jgi:capsular exopolysaccharide synthesis family protein
LSVPTSAPQPERESLKHALDVIGRRWVIVAAAVLACVAAALIQHATSGDVYEASARVVFGSPTLSDAALQVDRNAADPEREAATNVLIAESEEVASAVRTQLGVSIPAADLLDAISVEAEENADVLLITASSSSPSTAAQLANAFADQYIAFKASNDVQDIKAAEDDLRRQLRALPRRAPERDALRDSLQRLASLRAVATGDAQVIGRASPPAEPSRLGLAPVLVLAVIIGLAIGLAIVFLRETMDTRLNHLEEFEQEYRLPALVGIPTTMARPDEQNLEPYRIVRSALDFARVSRQLDVLMVTSAIPGEGKTTVAVNLARAISLTGRAVVLVELDLRRPTFARHLDIDPRGGVTAALTQQAPLGELLQTPVPDHPNLAVLPAGRLPPNPSELLGSPAMEELLRQIAADGAMVILDAPPLLPVADAQVLLNLAAVDSSLIVARARVTMRDEVRRTRAILDRHVRPPFGLVVVGVDADETYDYGLYASVDETDETAEAVPARLDDVYD